MIVPLWAVIVCFIVIVLVVWGLVARRANHPCPAWLSCLVEFDNPIFRSHRAAVIIANLDLKPGMRVLDVGCGPGRLTIPMAKIVGSKGRVVAVDLQEGMLRRVEITARRSDLTNIEISQVKMGNGKLTPDRFNRAVLVMTLGEIPNKEAALKEIFESLVPGGVLALAEMIADPHFQSRNKALALATAAGFRESFRIGGRFAFVLYLEKPMETPS